MCVGIYFFYLDENSGNEIEQNKFKSTLRN